MKLKSLMCLSVLFALTVTLVSTSETDAQVSRMLEKLVVGEPEGPDDPEPPPKTPEKCYKFDFDVVIPEGFSCELSPEEDSCIQHIPSPDGDDNFSRCPGIVTQEIEITENECVDCKKGAKGCKACKLENRTFKKSVAVGALVCPETPEDGECGCKWVLVPDIDDDWLEENGLETDIELPIWEFIDVKRPSGVECKPAMIDIPEIDVEEQDIENIG